MSLRQKPNFVVTCIIMSLPYMARWTGKLPRLRRNASPWYNTKYNLHVRSKGGKSPLPCEQPYPEGGKFLSRYTPPSTPSTPTIDTSTLIPHISTLDTRRPCHSRHRHYRHPSTLPLSTPPRSTPVDTATLNSDTYALILLLFIGITYIQCWKRCC